MIRTRPATREYREGFDRIFGRRGPIVTKSVAEALIKLDAVIRREASEAIKEFMRAEDEAFLGGGSGKP